MKNIKLMNKIAACGTDVFPASYTVSQDVEGEDGILVRCVVDDKLYAKIRKYIVEE